MKRSSSGPTTITAEHRAALEKLIDGTIAERAAARAMLHRIDSQGPPGKGKGRPWFEAALLFATALADERSVPAAPTPTRHEPDRCLISGKVIFPSETAAKRSMRSKSARLRAYRCPECLGWHLTSRT